MSDNKPFLTTEDFIQHFDKFRSGLFRASLDHYLQTGLPSGSLYLSINEYNEKANAKIAELEEIIAHQGKHILIQADRIAPLKSEIKKLREERDEFAIKFLEFALTRLYRADSHPSILIEQFKQSHK